MSRATWYRHGKPDKKRERMTVAKQAAMVNAPSVRTFQRLMRVMQDPDLAPLVAAKNGLKPGQAEKLLTDPKRKRRMLTALKLAAAKAAKSKQPKRTAKPK
jgi:hypothetical protein